MKLFKSSHYPPLLKSSGFSLLEILIAIAVMGLAVGLVGFNSTTERQRLKEAMDNITRALEFAKGEAVIRNRVVRVKLDLSKSPAEYSVESSESSQLTLPEYVDTSKLSKKELEAYEKEEKTINSGFIPIEAFKDSAREINPDILISGVGTNLSRRLMADEEAYIYFYPTGFQDTSIILMASYDEVVSLELESVRDRVSDNYFLLDEFLDENYEDVVYAKTKEVYDKWSEENEIK